jgi:hypothetical protein
LIGESYSSIATGEFALSVGLPDTEALALALQQPGWSHDTQQK